ncbi:MAG: class I SAM-dependent methyltransferase [Thermoplasmata archaeon]
MPTREVAAQFDQISLVYDETRDPLDPPTVDGLVNALRLRGAASVLEVGVGTGRVAKPLIDRGISVVGIDASRGMLARARSKGLPNLVRGSGYHLPFSEGTFDATLFVHVLHVLDDPSSAVREATRVSRVGAFALVHPRGTDGAGGAHREDEPRHLVREILAEQGFPVSARSSPWTKERDFLALHPPDSTEVVSEKDVTETLRSRIDRLAKRGQRNLLDIPPEALSRAIELARERAGDRTVTVHRVESLVTWSSDRWPHDAAAFPPAGSADPTSRTDAP